MDKGPSLIGITAGLLLLAAGCVPDAEPNGQPTPQPGAQPKLVGTEWQLVEFESSDDAIGVIRPGTDEVYTLQLNPDGTLAARLFCNRATGRWTSPDTAKTMGSLTLELSAMTTAACPPSRLERLGSDMSHVRSFVIQDGRLHLNLKLDSGNYVWAPQ